MFDIACGMVDDTVCNTNLLQIFFIFLSQSRTQLCTSIYFYRLNQTSTFPFHHSHLSLSRLKHIHTIFPFPNKLGTNIDRLLLFPQKTPSIRTSVYCTHSTKITVLCLLPSPMCQVLQKRWSPYCSLSYMTYMYIYVYVCMCGHMYIHVYTCTPPLASPLHKPHHTITKTM